MPDNRKKKAAEAKKRLKSCEPLSKEEVYENLCANRDHYLLEFTRLTKAGDYHEAKKIKPLLNSAVYQVERYELCHPELVQKGDDQGNIEFKWDLPLPDYQYEGEIPKA